MSREVAEDHHAPWCKLTAQVFSTLNELAIEAVRTRAERITDEAIEAWRPAVDKEAAFS